MIDGYLLYHALQKHLLDTFMKRNPSASSLPVVQAQVDPEESMRPQRLKKAALLKKAIWIHTWVLLSFVLSQPQIQTTAAVSVPEHSWTNNGDVDSETLHQLEVKQETREPDDTDNGVIVVATVDGTLAGLSRKTGKTLWKQSGIDSSDGDQTRDEHMRPSNEKEKNYNSKTRLLSPLLSTTTTTQSSDFHTAAVPSVDGSVYLTVGREASGAPETENVKVSDLVSRAPFVDGRGSFYVGSRHSTAAALDRDTGEILRVVSGENMAPNECGNIAERSVVWLGRTDHSVSMYDTRTGASDVQFSTSQVMSVQDMLAGTGHPAEQRRWDENLEHAPHLDSDGLFQKPPKPALIIATPNGNVAFRNADTGDIEWVAEEAFDSPVAFAVLSSTGESLGVDILPDTPVPSSSSEYISRELQRQMEALTNHQKEEQPLVGSLSSGQLYAMPLARKTYNPYQSLGIPHQHTIASNVSKKPSKLTRQGSGLQAITGKHAQDVTSHHHREQMKIFKRPCSSSNPEFPGCLLGSVYKQSGSTNAYYQHQHQQLPPLELDSGINEQAVTIHYHPEIVYVAKQDHIRLLHRNKTTRSFFKIMASWLPPTMALIFVLSFEFGRRHKLRKEEEAKKTETNQLIDGEMESSRESDTGVIQLTDEILGYGGHGTMVYKGTLDGRQVAVKRMLKTYHASADREISLLIESDGHPNVVRYFLKEVRGDFVYLALELCDLSLHDMIGSMNSQKAKEMQSNGVSPAVQSTMLQIASGVRHLHSLRIVHRDLKPANILLAKTKRKGSKGDHNKGQSFLAKFERGEYIAKISDMGLGKQLAGQSSFGFSTLGHGSLANMASNGSTMTGAGPGSVGWQAPEVMAVRWHAEAQSGRSDSSSGIESITEASPLDIAMNSRTSRSVDIFSLGCIFYSTLIPGSHPFGEWYEREANIMRNKPRTEALKEISEDAYDLITAMIDRDPKARPTAKQVCNHPFFWTHEQRLSFLCDISDRLECADTVEFTSKSLCLALGGNNSLAIERNAAQVVGMAWDTNLDPDLVTNVARFRTYDPSSVRDCLRLIRNKHHHYDELSAEIKERIGTNPDGLQQYFESRFPRLLMHCYTTLREQITADDPLAAKYMITPCARVMPLSESQPTSVTEPSRATNQLDPQNSTVIEPRSPQHEEEGEDDAAQCEYVESLLEKSDRNEESSSGSDSSFHIKDADPLCDGSLTPMIQDVTAQTVDTPVVQPSLIEEPTAAAGDTVTDDIIVWEGSTAAKSLGCRGWLRSDDEWIRKTDLSLRKRNNNILRCADDPKFRTRLCNHWDVNQGTFCPMRRKGKCVFAHGPVELRVKEGKRNRWGKLVDENGDNSNPKHSGGEDTYGAARSIETVRKEEGKWNTNKTGKAKGRPQGGKKRNGSVQAS
jgi:serine/threonine-protein kinase/endoribonuclease IRE1